MSVSDFCSAIAANWISVLAPAALVALYYRFFGRRRFLAFFGLDGSRAVTVYVSNLNVPSGTAVALDGAARSYSGGAVPEYEVRLLPTLHRTFNLLGAGTDRLPDVLKRILASDIEVIVLSEVVISGGRYTIQPKVYHADHTAAGACLVPRSTSEADQRCAFVDTNLVSTTACCCVNHSLPLSPRESSRSVS